LSAEEERDVSLPLSDTDCESSAFVAGCVNVISGTYSDHEVDLVVPGTEAIVLSRSHNTNDYKNGALKNGWRNSLYSHLYGGRFKVQHKNNKPTVYREINHIEASGAGSSFHGPNIDGDNTYNYHPHLESNFGATNVGTSNQSKLCEGDQSIGGSGVTL